MNNMTAPPTHIQQARDTKQALLDTITAAQDHVDSLIQELQRARQQVIIALQIAANSGLTSPGERQRAARISKQHRARLEDTPLPTPAPDDTTQDPALPYLTDPAN